MKEKNVREPEINIPFPDALQPQAPPPEDYDDEDDD